MDNAETQTAKKQARKAVLARRDALPIISRIDRSAEICEQIGKLLHDLLPDVLTDEALSTPPVSIPTPELPYMRPAYPYTGAMESADDSTEADAAHGEYAVAEDTGNATADATTANDEPLACHTGQEWIFEPRSTRPDSEKPMLALYSSMRSEVDLSELAHGAFAHDWRVCFPAMIVDATEEGDVAPVEEPAHMEFFEVSWAQLKALTKSFLSEQLRTYTVSQLEASGFKHVEPAQITAMIVPMVAFDGTNMRLGYGGGNYDRYLSKLSDNAVVIGAAFDEQEIEKVPAGDFDLPLPHIVHA